MTMVDVTAEAQRLIDAEAVRAEEARDLRKQLSDLGGEEQLEIILKETSPPRRKVIIYSMEDGSAVPVYHYRLESYMARRMKDGRPMFTSDPAKAPTYIRGDVKCFMAEGSPEKETLRKIGINKSCAAVHLPNEFAKEQHARKKHRAEWASYEAHISRQRDDEWRLMQMAQTEAMMALARGNTPPEKAAK